MYNICEYIPLIIVFILGFILWFKTYENFTTPNFDCHIINLDRNTSRLAGSLNYYNQSDLNFVPLKRFSAIDGKKLELSEIEKIVTPSVYKGILELDSTNKRSRESQLTRGMIGCYLSHLEIYKKILEGKYNMGIVFEDDIVIDSNIYKNSIKDIDKIYPCDWDIILLGYITFFDYKDQGDYYDVYNFWGLQGYVISKKGAKKIIKYGLPINQQIDHYMSKLAKGGYLNIYASKQNMVVQNSVYSDVQMQVVD